MPVSRQSISMKALLPSTTRESARILDSNGKASINQKLPLAQGHMRRQRHQVKRSRVLSDAAPPIVKKSKKNSTRTSRHRKHLLKAHLPQQRNHTTPIRRIAAIKTRPFDHHHSQESPLAKSTADLLTRQPARAG
jgi:hypothetical protein